MRERTTPSRSSSSRGPISPKVFATSSIARYGVWAGDQNAPPVINLQTNSGGGKTHSMLALWHLGSRTPLGDHPQDVQDLLAETRFAELAGVRRVALVGNHIAPSGSVKADGTQVNTIWGELAWQLGGKETFATVATADADRTPPGKALHDLLATYAPAVILIDEWVAYARSLVGRDDLAGGTFDVPHRSPAANSPRLTPMRLRRST
jgi:predicted AAA+ superfamily ATPase